MAKATKAHALALARKRHGEQGRVWHNPRAITAVQRQRYLAELQEIQAEHKRVSEELKALPHNWQHLLEAAEFVVEVWGSPGSIDKLKEVAEASRRHVDLMELQSNLKSALRKVQGLLSSSRWSAGYLYVGINHVDAWADTLEGLIAKLEAKERQDG